MPANKSTNIDMIQGSEISIHLDGDGGTFEIVKQPRHAAFALDPGSGHFQYRPEKDFSGIDSFTYVTTDKNGVESEPHDVVIEIKAATGEKILVVDIVVEIPEKPTVDDILEAFDTFNERIFDLVHPDAADDEDD